MDDDTMGFAALHPSYALMELIERAWGGIAEAYSAVFRVGVKEKNESRSLAIVAGSDAWS
jgi:hypothetical protein